jgi:hypothetical protein
LESNLNIEQGITITESLTLIKLWEAKFHLFLSPPACRQAGFRGLGAGKQGVERLKDS